MSKRPYRWPCSVPGCRCTIGADRPMESSDWALCRKHWPLVPREMKRARRIVDERVERTYRAGMLRGWRDETTKAHERAFAAMERIHKRLVRKACERALGIG